ncbi:hypothetical protein PIB30_030963 [Stylosanthes scabra]|uniref:Peptidase A1 domain-containing protein n=1 Tax=Stylosanthes scabra TaxID=79078 RepID=A0ABU6TBF3_9FABA|nr:hypothetical protein [Stylosanthes scabra]
MALILHLTFLFLTTIMLALSLTVSPSTEFSTTLLDVTASLHPQQTQPNPTPPPSSSFTLQLYPTHSLHNPPQKDHLSNFLAQLNRDKARVNSIVAKLQLAISQVNESEVRPEYLSSPVTSGESQGSGEYFARIGVGQPPHNFNLDLDTGSDITWLQCKPCERCFQQVDPIFDPSGSPSYGQITCDAPQCRQLDQKPICKANKCQYQVNYGDGSVSMGDFITETVWFGKTESVPRVPLGCGHFNVGLFAASAGILGLGRGPLSLPSQIKATSFSYCLVARGSNRSSTLDFNSAQLDDSVVTRMLSNPKVASFYYAGFTGISIGGRRVPVPVSTFEIDSSGNGGILVDSGTAVTWLQNQAYEAVRDAFTSLTVNLPRVPGRVLMFDTCYNFSGFETVKVPTVSFVGQGGKSWSLAAEAYIIPLDRTAGTFCFAMAPMQEALSILGNVQQQGTRVSFDIANSLIGFSPNKC